MVRRTWSEHEKGKRKASERVSEEGRKGGTGENLLTIRDKTRRKKDKKSEREREKEKGKESLQRVSAVVI